MNLVRPLDRSCRLCTEAVPAALFAVVYLAYLWIHPESEAWHWVSIVILPLVVVAIQRRGVRGLLSSFGLRRSNWRNRLGLAITVGLAISLLQLVVGSRGSQALEVLSTPEGWLMLPVTLLFLVLTAGFTEEFFFRGFLQTRLETRFHSPWVAIAVVTLLFSLYHVPYAYLNPAWTSSGNLGDSITAAFTQGVPGGLVLGWLYWKSDRNLVACVALHSLINWLPALTMIKVTFGGS